MRSIVLSVCILFVGLCLLLVLRRDWVRLTRPKVRVNAQVIGHRTGLTDRERDYAAIYLFTAMGRPHEVADEVTSITPTPDVGTIVALEYPEGRPDLARKPRPLMWLLVYGFFLGLLGLLVGLLNGWISG